MQLRVNIRRIKLLVWLLCALTFLYAGYTFYEIYSDKVAGRYSARKSTIFADLLTHNVNANSLNPRAGKEGFYPEDRYKKLWDALVDGSVRPVDAGPVAPVEPALPQFVLPDLSAIIHIGLVVYSKSPVERFVALSYVADAAKGGGGAPGGAPPTAGKEVRLHLSEGDPLKPPYDAGYYNGKVLRIGLQEVVFQWGETEVTLTPSLGSEGGGQTLDQFKVAPSIDPTAGVQKAPDDSVEVAPGHWIIGTKDISRMKHDPQAFMSEELNVHSVTGVSSGRTELEVSEVKAGSLAAQYGVKTGDKIISVNGFPMSSVSAAINWAKANPDLPMYVIAYEHAGQLKTVTIHVK